MGEVEGGGTDRPRAALGVGAACAAAAVVVTWPLVLHLGSAIRYRLLSPPGACP